MKYKFEENTSHLHLSNRSAKYFAMKKGFITSEFMILKLQNQNEHTQNKKIVFAFL